MALTTPAIPYISIRDALLTLFRDNLATLNNNLSTTITDTTNQIIKGDALIIPELLSRYPYIILNPVSKSEEFAGLGAGGRKLATLTFRIYGICEKMTSSADDDDEAIRLCENIESVLRDNIAFHSSILFCQPMEAEFNTLDLGQDVYVSAVGINLDCRIRVI